MNNEEFKKVESIKRLKSEKWRVKNLHIQFWKHLFNIDFDTSPLSTLQSPLFNKVNKRLSEYANKQFNKMEVFENSPKSLLIRLIRLFTYSPIRPKIAFTLAEVLITLGIIGVVAALTIPTLVQNYQKKVTVERLKSTYSILAQAIKMSEIDNGVPSEWELISQTADDDAMQAYAEKYFMPYLKHVKQCNGSFTHCFADTYYYMNKEVVPDTRTGYSIMLNNGVALRIHSQKEWNTTGFTVDINGRKNPNTIGKDTFNFVLKHGEFNNWGLGINQSIGTLFVMGQGNTNDVLKNASNMGCSKSTNVTNAGILCGAWIIQNGWQMPDDYPW